ncbi:helix-turn-helix domain-containing protein [Brevibacterium antiquum]|uniref:winged helix-turn-helix transcriptional regulator n=1 Tax=Brevibacterium antiquum TaxID=234835 RepID=UPI0018DFDBFD|nr:helix-turn-helix domain-containing protein [Brevibacterium antiquum]
MQDATKTAAIVNEYTGDEACSLARAVSVVGQRWSYFILREALAGTTRFTEFRQRLGIASDVLTTRLETLVGAGLMQTQEYREFGQRTRWSYHLTESGRQMMLTIAALQQWGDEWTPSPVPTSVSFRDQHGRQLTAAFVDPEGRVVPIDDVEPIRTSKTC